MAKKQQRGASPAITLLAVLLCVLLIGIEPIKKVLSDKPQATSNKEQAVGTLRAASEGRPDGKSVTRSSSPVADKKPVDSSPSPVANEELAVLDLTPTFRSTRPASKILKRRGYILSYNSDTKQPNWVTWKLDRERLKENESRTNKFLPDPDLPEREAVTTDDYRGSGYDRGHMCPAGDNRYHWMAMQQSFYMTNICPQDHKLNGGDWKELEEACRRWAVQTQGGIYIVCGPIFYKSSTPEYIGRKQRIRVPDAFFKVVLSLDRKQGIGFIYKNYPSNKKMSSYVNTIDQVERITGLDFFPALPDKLEQQIESTCDPKLWKIKE